MSVVIGSNTKAAYAAAKAAGKAAEAAAKRLISLEKLAELEAEVIGARYKVREAEERVKWVARFAPDNTHSVADAARYLKQYREERDRLNRTIRSIKGGLSRAKEV